MSTKIANHNATVRLLLFFARPLHIFNVVLLFQLWNYLSYSPTVLSLHFRGTTAQAFEFLWQEQFSSYVWYFLIAAVLDIAVQEYLPLILND